MNELSNPGLAIPSSTIVPMVATPATSNRRVLHVVNGEYYAGAERVQDLLAQYLPDAGWDVGFACVKADEFPARRQCRNVPIDNAPMSHPWATEAVGKIAQIIRQHHYDVVHSHTPRSAWAACRAAAIAGCPFVHTMHDVSLGQSVGWARRLMNRYTVSRLRKADCVTTVSPATYQLAQQLGIGKQRRMILNGVAGARREFSRTNPAERGSGQAWNLGTVALLRPCKGIEVLIRAVANLRDRGCNARATIVGTFATASYEQEVMKLVHHLDVGDRIEFAGFSDDVPSFLETFDLFVMPSVGPEGLPMVVLESMAHGLPTIGSDVPGVGDVVRSGIDGLLFPPGDDGALADAVERFVSGNIDWSSLSRTARSRHAAEFSAERMADEFARIYNGLL